MVTRKFRVSNARQEIVIGPSNRYILITLIKSRETVVFTDFIIDDAQLSRSHISRSSLFAPLTSLRILPGQFLPLLFSFLVLFEHPYAQPCCIITVNRYKLIIAINSYFLKPCINFLDGSFLNDAIDLIRERRSISRIINASAQLNINLTRIAATISIRNLY